MTQQQNTDGKFWGYKQVAQRAYTPGKHRASIILFSELYDWTPEALEETVARANQQNPSILLPPMSRADWEYYHASVSARSGFCYAEDFREHGAEALMINEAYA